MPMSRLLAAFAAGALVTVPGLALAQGASPFETPPAETPPVEVPAEADLEEVEEEPEIEAEEEPEVEEVPELEAEEEPDLEVEVEDEGHGEAISALALCLPSGRDLHGTGFTKGFVMSQAASSGQVVIDAHGIDQAVTTPQEAEDLCALVTAVADSAEAPDTAKGRPDWAGPQDDAEGAGGDVQVEDVDGEGRGGPPPWAGSRGGPTGPR